MSGALLRSLFSPLCRHHHHHHHSPSGLSLARYPAAHHHPPTTSSFRQQLRHRRIMIPAQTDTYRLEREVAVAAVLQAIMVTRRIFDKLIRPHLSSGLDDKPSITKLDRSPVTVGDYTVQALVNFILSKYFPDDEIVGEEDSSELLNTTDKKHLEQIVDFTHEAMKEDRLSTAGDEERWAKFRDERRLSEDDLVKLIDLGNSVGGEQGRNRRFWTLDPIDGTKGFLRGEQYAICLALIVDGQVVLGVVGTPNLPLRGISCPPGQQPEGVLFFAEKGAGAHQRPLDSNVYSQIRMHSLDRLALGREGTFCESTEAAHSNHHLTLDIASQLKMVNAQNPIRIDSQAKYCILARGDTNMYFRFPTSPDYQEKIWDHAAGSILVSEAGGKVTDMTGRLLDFSCGRTLSNNTLGFVACHDHVSDHVLSHVDKVARDHKYLSPP